MVQGPAPLSKAIALLRQSVQAQRRGTAGAGRTPKPSGIAAGSPATPGKPSKVATLAAGLAAIDPTDPNRRTKALRAFIEATLQDEFGAELILSADFQAMVDKTVDTLLKDASMLALLDRAAAELGFPG